MQNLKLAENFKRYVAFTTTELDLFFSLAERMTYEKGKFLIKKDEETASFYLIESGCLMTYVSSNASNQNHVLQFGTDYWWTGDIESIMNETLSQHTIKAVERTSVYKLTKTNYEALVDSNPNFERFFRILFQRSLISHQKRIVRNISFTAEERYQNFVKQYPLLEQKVAQKYIASYLGVTPEFLSKLKKQMAERELK